MEANELVTDVLKRLRSCTKISKEIAAEAGVTHSWLKMFRRGEIQNPGVQQFQKLVAWLDAYQKSQNKAVASSAGHKRIARAHDKASVS